MTCLAGGSIACYVLTEECSALDDDPCSPTPPNSSSSPPPPPPPAPLAPTPHAPTSLVILLAMLTLRMITIGVIADLSADLSANLTVSRISYRLQRVQEAPRSLRTYLRRKKQDAVTAAGKLPWVKGFHGRCCYSLGAVLAYIAHVKPPKTEYMSLGLGRRPAMRERGRGREILTTKTTPKQCSLQ